MRGRLVVVALIAACRSAPAPAPAQPASRESSARAEPDKPERQRLVVTSTSVEILDPIQFLAGSPALDPRSARILDAIASTLLGNPSIRLVEVHAYGADALAQFQARVGADRAQTIVNELVARGVDRKRLVAAGKATAPNGRPSAPEFEILLREP